MLYKGGTETEEEKNSSAEKLHQAGLQSHGLTPQTVTAVTDQGCSVSLELSEGPPLPATSSTAEP